MKISKIQNEKTAVTKDVMNRYIIITILGVMYNYI